MERQSFIDEFNARKKDAQLKKVWEETNEVAEIVKKNGQHIRYILR